MSKFVALALFVILEYVSARGTVHEPVARQTRWRYDSSAPQNYDDTGVNCGGIATQFQANDGKCGFCGDNYADSQPRKNELGGQFGQGVIVETYNSGAVMPVKIQLAANHMGYFEFQLCNLDSNGGRESDACFEQNKLKLTNGSERYPIQISGPGWIDINLQLPSSLTCSHCVLQWTYVAGNNWGTCEDGSGAVGCGPQEHIRACSDITIQ